MSLWSRIKKAVKKVWRAVKTVVRVVLKAITGLVMRIINILGEIITLGFAAKNMRIQIFVLQDAARRPVVDPALFQPAIAEAKAVFKREFNVTLKSYGKPEVQVLGDVAPAAALDVDCDGGAFSEEFGEAGEYFADNTAGWVGIPISLGFPVNVFVVRSILDKIGCSIPITDYVTISATPSGSSGGTTGVTSPTTLAHELGHTCLLAHRDDQPGNLMYPNRIRGTDTTWWQRRVARTSRHCTFW
jgi:hypothetical protein